MSDEKDAAEKAEQTRDGKSHRRCDAARAAGDEIKHRAREPEHDVPHYVENAEIESRGKRFLGPAVLAELHYPVRLSAHEPSRRDIVEGKPRHHYLREPEESHLFRVLPAEHDAVYKDVDGKDGEPDDDLNYE